MPTKSSQKKKIAPIKLLEEVVEYKKLAKTFQKIQEDIKQSIPKLEDQAKFRNMMQHYKIENACANVDYNDDEELDRAMKLTKLAGERVNMHKTLSGKVDSAPVALQINLNSVDDSAKNTAESVLKRVHSVNSNDNK